MIRAQAARRLPAGTDQGLRLLRRTRSPRQLLAPGAGPFELPVLQRAVLALDHETHGLAHRLIAGGREKLGDLGRTLAERTLDLGVEGGAATAPGGQGGDPGTQRRVGEVGRRGGLSPVGADAFTHLLAGQLEAEHRRAGDDEVDAIKAVPRGLCSGDGSSVGAQSLGHGTGNGRRVSPQRFIDHQALQRVLPSSCSRLW